MSDFTFGIVSDTQYVDADDGTTFDGSTVRRHRQSLETLKKACRAFTAVSNPPINTCVLMGDVLDGKCKKMGNTEQCITEVFCALTLSPPTCQWHFCIGNHDLLCFTRDEILRHFTPTSLKDVCAATQLYYDYVPFPGCRFIFLDGYDKSVLGPSRPEYQQEMEQLMTSKNPNLSIDGAPWFHGLSSMDMRYVPYNGAVSDEQLIWLENTLQFSYTTRERAFIFTHMPLYAGCCRPAGLLINAEAVMAILHKYPGTVGAVFAGHDHDGGYNCDAMDIHHIIPPSPLECDLDEVAYGHVSVHLAPGTVSGRDPEGDFFTLHWTGKTPTSPHYATWPGGKKLRFPKFE